MTAGGAVKRPPSGGGPSVFLASLALHAALVTGLALVPRRPAKQAVAITIRTVHRPTAPVPTPATPPPPAPAAPAPPRPHAPPPPRVAHAAAPSHAAPPAAAPAPAAAPHPAAAADFGLTMSGSSGGTGVNAPQGGGSGGGGEKAAPAAHAKGDDDGCGDALVRAKPLEVPQPEYPDSARDTGVEGKVRVEIDIDTSGAVRDARVVTSLSAALDAAALDAARRGRFTPATRCGQPVASTFVLGIRFEL